MKFLFVCLVLNVTRTLGAITDPQAPCKDWCGAFCLDSCQSTLTTPICMGDAQCRCLCPTRKADCNNSWCSAHCHAKAQTRHFEAHCDPTDQVCRCQFEQTNAPSSVLHSRTQPVNITYVADETLLRAEFKCTRRFCDNYCTLRGEGRTFQANCDETQSCHCQYEQKPLPSLKSLTMGDVTTGEFKCTNEWCSTYCEAKSGGRTSEAACDEHQTCKCQYARQTFVKASGGPDRSPRLDTSQSSPPRLNTKFHCRQSWCDDYCEGKSNGRKFTASCNQEEACKCAYAWQPTGKRVFSAGSTTGD